MQKYEWIDEKLQIYSNYYKKIAVLPMDEWGMKCSQFFMKVGKENILCLDNDHFDNKTIFPVEREENWNYDLYLITAQDETECQKLELQISRHLDDSKIGRLFFFDIPFCETYGRVHFDFLCVGFPKCGTTSLQAALVQNTHIFLARTKETDFIHNIYLPHAQEIFHRLYKEKNTAKVVGGIEPAYVDCSYTISRYYGTDLKIIMCVRNPKKAVYSYFQMLMRQNAKKAEYYMNKYGNINPLAFDEWVNLESGKNIFRYMDFVKDYLKYYDEKNIKVILFEEMTRDTERVLDELQEYIGLDNDDKKKYDKLPHKNIGSSVPKSLAGVYINDWLMDLVYSQEDFDLREEINTVLRDQIRSITNIKYNEDMYDSTDKMLSIFYRDSIYELEKFLGRSLEGIWY